jgi:hypothetical protein
LISRISFSTVLWIRGILVWTRFRGSVSLTYPTDPDPALFVNGKMPQKISFLF